MGEDTKGFIAGWIAGCVGLIFSHPLDTIKVRMQSTRHKKLGVVAQFKTIITKEKLRGLFKGLTYPLLGQGAINAVVFGVESFVYKRLKQDCHDSLNVKSSVIAGLCAGSVQTVIVCPMELIKIRMQNQNVGKEHVSWIDRKLHCLEERKQLSTNVSKSYHGPLNLTKIILQTEGIKGMFRGWWITIFREVPQFGIYFGTYAWLRLKLASYNNVSPEDLRLPHLCFAGGITGIVTWCWYPADVIKTRLQNSRFNDNWKMRYNGITDCIIKSVRAEGIGVFCKGLQPTLIRGFANGVGTLPVFTLTMQLLSSAYV